ncbi:MAG TPA: lysyl oxidase family protein [Pyrinomonadaceae bacterium]|jgi:lysyl oxidase|nr:lysyl oxidase family protein [Pyrinomonadaceae bacterium]
MKRLALLAALVLLPTVLAVTLHKSRASGPKPKPDLIVDQKRLLQNWVVRDENLPASFCSVQEGGVEPGEHTLLRFTVSTPNIGTADVNLGDPNAHVAAGDGLYEYATCHRHFHFRHYTLYELIDANGFIWRAAKRGFCMIDVEKYQAYPGPANNDRNYLSCGAPATDTQPAIPGNQGISIGWADTYVWKLGGQYFVLDGGDGQPVVPPGDYTIRITVNPPFVAQAGEACPYLDTHGFCHQLPELNYDNNISEIQITIPPHPGKQGVGPLKNQPQLTAEPID